MRPALYGPGDVVVTGGGYDILRRNNNQDIAIYHGFIDKHTL